jgi:hypothetical protein
MIVNGSSNRCVWWWTQHLESDVNEKVRIVESHGLRADSIRDMLDQMMDLTCGTNVRNGFYQINMNPAPGENLTEKDWERAREIAEKKHGLEGQPYFMVMHTKHGREHPHFIYSRVDLETGKAISDSNDARKNHAIAREIERELGLERVVGPYDREPGAERPERAPKRWEMYRGMQTGIDPRDIAAEVTELFQQSPNGQTFQAALEQHGYTLAKGDRRGFVILDTAGKEHSLARRIEGVNTKELNAFMRDVDREALPTVEQAKARHQELRIAGLEADRATVQHEIAWEEGLAKAAIEKEKIERRFVEPEKEETTAKGSREKEAVRSPFEPPAPASKPHGQLNKKSPEHWFEDVARQTTNPASIPEPPENFKGAARQIWTAWHHSDNARAFAAALGEHGISLAAVTKDEADRSHRQAEFAKAVGNFALRYREGEIVAVGPQGRVYQLNERTTGEKPANIEKFLATLDRSQLNGIEATRHAIQDRGELREIERQAFRDLSGIGLLTQETDRAAGRKDPKRGRERDVSAAPLKGAAGRAVETIANIAGEAIEMLGDMFGATEMTEERIRAILDAREQRADQFEIHLEKLRADEDHDRRAKREHEITEQQERERQETDRKRDRERDR